MLLKYFWLAVWFKFSFIKLQSYTCGGMSGVTQNVDTHTHTHCSSCEENNAVITLYKAVFHNKAVLSLHL